MNWRFLLCISLCLPVIRACSTPASGQEKGGGQPTESECRPLIEAALKGLHGHEGHADSEGGEEEVSPAGSHEEEMEKEEEALTATSEEEGNRQDEGEEAVVMEEDVKEEEGEGEEGRGDGEEVKEGEEKEGGEEEKEGGDEEKNVEAEEREAGEEENEKEEKEGEEKEEEKEEEKGEEKEGEEKGEEKEGEEKEEEKEGEEEEEKEVNEEEEKEETVKSGEESPEGHHDEGGESVEEEESSHSAETAIHKSDQEADKGGEDEHEHDPEEDSRETEGGAEEEDQSEEKEEGGEGNEEDVSGDDESGEEGKEDEEGEEEAEEHLRPKEMLEEFLAKEPDTKLDQATEKALKEFKRLYEIAIRPMETIYKYHDITTRHFGDSEIHAVPMVLLVGPWGTGKTSAIKYLIEGEDDFQSEFHIGASPKDDRFHVYLYGDDIRREGGTELNSNWVFASLQKFGMAFANRFHASRLPSRLLKKVIFVDTPGLLESRNGEGQHRLYPVNDVFQWFIDRADIVLAVFDPHHLEAGIEMEALFDQLKGREDQVRILFNKANELSAAELSHSIATLMWNLSPLLGGNKPPRVYAVDLRDEEEGGNESERSKDNLALIESNEEDLAKDIIDIILNRVENKATQTRKHAIRVRNHSKLVNCYLRTYIRSKGFFSNRKKVANEIVDHPNDYRIYEGVSTLTNVSRYDLPDPDVYRAFFKLHDLWEFPKAEDTCTYFKGCPHDKLDLTIAYDLAEVVGKFKKEMAGVSMEPIPHGHHNQTHPASNSTKH